MAGDLNAKHTDWNSGLTRARGSFLHPYANRNSCFICGPDSHTTVLYTQNVTPEVLGSVAVKGLRPAGASYYSVKSARITFLSWYTHHVSLIHLKPVGPARLHANRLGRIPGFPWRQTPSQSHGKRQGDNGQVRWGEYQRHSIGRSGICSRASNPCPTATLLPNSIHDETCLKDRLRQWQDTRKPALKDQVNRLQKLGTYWLNEWRNEQGSDALESFDSENQMLWKMKKRVMRVPTLSPPCKCQED
jgi:hypothetical protein